MWYLTTVHDLSPPHPNLVHAAVKPLSHSWFALKRQQYLKATKPEKWLFFFIIILFKKKRKKEKSFSSPGVKLDLGSVKCLRVWPSPGVACHIQLWAPNRKALTHLSLFSYYSTSTGIKKILPALWWCCFWFGRYAASLHQTVAASFFFCLRGKMKEEIQMLSCFLSVSCATLDCESPSFEAIFWFSPHTQMAFRC